MSATREDPQENAWNQGRRSAFIDAQLDSHEKRLNAINGSISNGARSVTSLGVKVDALDDRISQVIARLDTAAAVEMERQKLEQKRVSELQRANDNQIGRRAWWVGIATVVVMLAGVILALAQTVHG